MKLANIAFHQRLGAWFYDAITFQDIWRDAVGHMVSLAHVSSAEPRVLDLGCGPGVSTFALRRNLPVNASLVGVDISARMIDRAREHHGRVHRDLDNIEFRQADAAALPFDDDAFDLVVGHSFLYLLDDAVAVLREVERVLAPGGSVIFMEPSRDGSLLDAALRHAQPVDRWLSRPRATMRFGLSMVLWRVFSAQAGQLSRSRLTTLFVQAGFPQVSFEPALGGLGVYARARLPGVASRVASRDLARDPSRDLARS